MSPTLAAVIFTFTELGIPALWSRRLGRKRVGR